MRGKEPRQVWHLGGCRTAVFGDARGGREPRRNLRALAGLPSDGRSAASPNAACIDMGLPRIECLALGRRGVGREVGMLRGGFGHGVTLGFMGWRAEEASVGEGSRKEPPYGLHAQFETVISD